MRGLVLFIVLVVIIVSFSFVAASINHIEDKKIEKKDENKAFEFSTFTSAVCENKADIVHCKDEVFVNCNGSISKAADVAECDGIKIDVPKATGSAVFGSDWKDPRN